MGKLFVSLIAAMAAVGIFLFAYIDRLNELTELRIRIPRLERKSARLKEILAEEEYRLQKALSPKALLELRTLYPQFHFPIASEVIYLPDEEVK